MTVINNDARDQYTATNGQTIFNYTFEISDEDNIQVYQRVSGSDPDDVADILTLNVDYTVTGVGVNTGGTIVLTVGAALNDIVSLQGNAPPVRSTSFTAGGVIQAANLNTEFDDEILIYQTILARLDFLVPAYPKSAVVQDFDLVLPILGVNQIWQMNELGTAIEAVTFDSSTSAAALEAELASHSAGEGASMIGLEGTGTVQDLAEAKFILQVANAAAPNAQALGALTTGIVRSTTTTGVLSIDAGITSLSNLTLAADKLPYATALNTYALTDFTAFARTLLDDANAAAAAVTLAVLPLLGGTMLGAITLAADAAAAMQPVTLQQLQAAILNEHPACLVSTTANLAGYVYANGASGVGATLTAGGFGAFSADGVSPAINSRIFIPFQTAQAENGIYVLSTVGDGGTAAVLTRSTDFDTASEMNAGDVVSVVSGTTYATSQWMMTQTAAITVGTTAITWQQQSNTAALLKANNLSDLNNVATARTNLGLVIGTDVQAYDATLQSISALGTAANKMIYTTGIDTWAESDISAFGRSLIDDADAATARTTLGAAASGANADITSMTGLTGTLQAPTGVKSSAGLDLLTFTYTASAVNYIGLTNNTTGNRPLISAGGSDTNIELQLIGKGTGGVLTQGTSTNGVGAAGYVGEEIESIIANASAVNVPTATSTNVTSISLTAGDWQVWGNVNGSTFGTTPTAFFGWISTSSASAPDQSLYNGLSLTTGILVTGTGFEVPSKRISLAATTTVYLSTFMIFAAGTQSVCGGIFARRLR